MRDTDITCIVDNTTGKATLRYYRLCVVKPKPGSALVAAGLAICLMLVALAAFGMLQMSSGIMPPTQKGDEILEHCNQPPGPPPWCQGGTP